MARNGLRRELVHAKREAMPFPVAFGLVVLTSASLVSHRQDDVCDASDVSGGPRDQIVAVLLPMDFHLQLHQVPSPSRDRLDWD